MLATSVPIRKRRRPALSCVQCRFRKVRCDRKNPCSQCIQSNNSSCTYSADPRPSGVIHVGSHVNSSASSGLSFNHSTPFQNVTPDSTITSGIATATVPDGAAYQATGPTPSFLGRNDLEGTTINRMDHIECSEQTISNHHSELENSCTVFPSQDNGQHLRGSLSKTRYFGPSHVMTTFAQFDKILCYHHKSEKNLATFLQNERRAEIYTMLQKCKRIAKASKADGQVQWPIEPGFRNLVPSREISDSLVHLYLKTFESVHRILHIPSFWTEYTEYWDNPQIASIGFIVKLLLIMAIGTNFSTDSVNGAKLRLLTPQWIYTAQSWLSGPFEKRRLNMNGLQVYCLLLLARQINSVGAELVWISAGSLLRMAIQMGYNRDPACFSGMPVLHAEMRRRLWATILEISVQTSLDAGMQPLISFDDFDTKPPSNIDDVEIEPSTKTVPQHPVEVFTQTSLQIILFKSLRTRLEISRVINNFLSEPSYNEVLRLGQELTRASRDANVLAQLYASSNSEQKPTVFHRNLLNLLTRRFLLAVHFPFAIKARSDPHFHFSRSTCVEVALNILSFDEDEDFSRLVILGGGLFREVLGHAAMTICLELITQLEEEVDNTSSVLARKKSLREPLLQVVIQSIAILAKRIAEGENNVQGHVFMSMVLGQIEAMERGTSQEERIFEAAKKSLAECYDVMRARTASPTTEVSPPLERYQLDDEERMNKQHSAETQYFTPEFWQEPGLDFEMTESSLFTDWVGNSWF